ncbi:hypothetical protein DFP94_104113 [Fontibacillus phaseoli]|uniref:Lipoprotein n=1 Tax=Fontibacillus phaseoli TaxID=1416533 RepID=A0A369BE31_9BACL|nr:hypothetical protein [Fontibacillus phaseoli]RCX19661.1 hypothetical protein DFP94_104113 [Fontibacillus phaseoli]
MKKKWCIPSIMLLILALTGCGKLATEATEVPVITFDGTEITLGKSKLSELNGAGFTQVDSEYGFKGDSLEGMTFSPDLYYFTKGEEQQYAGLALLNEAREQKPIEECSIYRVSYDMNLPNTSIVYPDILINNVNYRGYSLDQVKETMEGKKIRSEDKRFIMYDDGEYKYTFDFGDDGTVVSINLEKDFPKYFPQP